MIVWVSQAEIINQAKIVSRLMVFCTRDYGRDNIPTYVENTKNNIKQPSHGHKRL